MWYKYILPLKIKFPLGALINYLRRTLKKVLFPIPLFSSGTSVLRILIFAPLVVMWHLPLLTFSILFIKW